MSTPNTDSNTDTSLAAFTPQHGSETPFEDVPHPEDTTDLGLDLVGSASLDSDARPPQSDPTSSQVLVSDANDDASGSKRKLEDSDSTSDSEAQTPDRKKPKQDSQDETTSSLITPRHASGIAGVESLNDPQLSEPLSLEDDVTDSKVDSSESTPFFTDASPLPTIPIDLPPSTTPPPRSHSAPPTSPVMPNGTSRALQFPPPSNIPADPEPLHTYSCPICFSSPTNATLTPCGHIMCGECLFTAVGAAAARMGIATLAARCPVCRAPIPRWDGRGGGVIGLQPRVVITI